MQGDPRHIATFSVLTFTINAQFVIEELFLNSSYLDNKCCEYIRLSCPLYCKKHCSPQFVVEELRVRGAVIHLCL